jgi:hypothetical protein
MYSETMCNVLNCYNIHYIMYTQFYLECPWFSVTSIGNKGCFKKGALKWYSKCYCVTCVTKTFTLKGMQTTHLLRWVVLFQTPCISSHFCFVYKIGNFKMLVLVEKSRREIERDVLLCRNSPGFGIAITGLKSINVARKYNILYC